MSSLGVLEVDLTIKGKKFTHPMNVINKLNENIIDIHVIHVHKLTSDVIAKKDMWTYSTNTRMHSASTNTTWAWPKLLT
jgi:hypothetical protein